LFYGGGRVNEIVFTVYEPPEAGYAAEALGQPIFTVADTLDELNEMVRDAVVRHFEEAWRLRLAHYGADAGSEGRVRSPLFNPRAN
jgi:hypothetical protein